MNEKSSSSNMRNIYLVGFMGVGKSTVARKVAHKLGLQFIDSDRAIEKNVGQSINDIFAKQGEEHFRKLERAFIESGHSKSGCVIACGGGLPIEDGIMDLLKSQGVVIGLFARSETILERTDRRENRPMLHVENKEERINELLKKRQDTYKEADYLFFSEGRRIEDVVGDIVRVYLRRSKQ